SIKLPRHRISEEQGYADGAYAYYRIHIPKQAFSQLEHLKGQTFLGLQYIFFKHLDIYVNGEHFAANTPNDSLESIINIPVENGVDNIVAIRGLIKAGDSTGIEHRGKLFLGKGAELNELHRKVYKGMTVFQLIFIL